MKQELIQKREQLKQLHLKISDINDLIKGKDGVAGRLLTTEENTTLAALLKENSELEEEIAGIQNRIDADIISKRIRQPKEQEDVKLAKRVSLDKVVQLAARNKFGATKSLNLGRVDFGAEEESAQEAARMAKESNVELIGIGIPRFVQDYHQRAVYGTANNAGNLADKYTDFSQFDFLTPDTLLTELGAQVVNNLVGVISLPSGDTIGNYAYATETGTAGQLSGTVSLKTVEPKRGCAYEPISFTMLNVGGIGINKMISDNLMLAEAIGKETVAFNGGASNQPAGIIGSALCPVVAIGANGGAITEAKWDELIKTLKTNNSGKNLKAVTTVAIAQRMANIKRDDGSGIFLLNADSMVAKWGVPMKESNLLPTTLVKGASSDCHPILVGDWTYMRILNWAFSSIDIDNRPKDGQLDIVFNSYNNVHWRQNKAFASINDARDL